MATTTLDMEMFFLKRVIGDSIFKNIDEIETEKTKKQFYEIITRWKNKIDYLQENSNRLEGKYEFVSNEAKDLRLKVEQLKHRDNCDCSYCELSKRKIRCVNCGILRQRLVNLQITCGLCRGRCECVNELKP